MSLQFLQKNIDTMKDADSKKCIMLFLVSIIFHMFSHGFVKPSGFFAAMYFIPFVALLDLAAGEPALRAQVAQIWGP